MLYNKSKAASKSTTNPQQIEAMEFSYESQTPLIRFVVDLLRTCCGQVVQHFNLLWICCGFSIFLGQGIDLT